MWDCHIVVSTGAIALPILVNNRGGQLIKVVADNLFVQFDDPVQGESWREDDRERACGAGLTCVTGLGAMELTFSYHTS
ncbi:hypothetical protein SARC_14081 [Sphaeroforma arctica JP610]|uniref:Uncharacterized protein n=1 Tax=Sphaeroforma arctica JP610 TaxID=667725 RepID=A0A0L0F9F9_9EUKA|nr:hypothetical protein SARC_14081 [Sphaeroforma arctica JP610]KNC73359.1 hypothetical protein SARC_14081 [Sphaeroforma arctica JP610]|eukprot:XP_014147261.1 hypothetical protein SARC_14081 [Sphaeroforma arctica JP610]